MERPNLVGSGSGHCQKWRFISRKPYGIFLPSSHRPGIVLGASSLMRSVGSDLVGMGRPSQVGMAMKAHSKTTREPENLRTGRASGRRQARGHHGRRWHGPCLADNIQPLGIVLLGSPARKLSPLGHLHRLSGTWQTGEAGSLPGGFLLPPCELAGGSLSARGGPL